MGKAIRLLHEKTTKFNTIKNPREVVNKLFAAKIPVEEISVSEISHNFTYRVYLQKYLFLKVSNPDRDIYGHFPEKGFNTLAFLSENNVNVPKPYYFFRVDLENEGLYSGYFAEWIDGIDLADLILRINQINNQELIKILLNIAEKIGALIGKIHNLGIIHNDFAPRNIMISWEKEVYIIDFDYSIPVMFSQENKDVSFLIQELEKLLYINGKFKKNEIDDITNLIKVGYNKETGLIKKMARRLKIVKKFILA